MCLLGTEFRVTGQARPKAEFKVLGDAVPQEIAPDHGIRVEHPLTQVCCLIQHEHATEN